MTTEENKIRKIVRDELRNILMSGLIDPEKSDKSKKDKELIDPEKARKERQKGDLVPNKDKDKSITPPKKK